MDTIRNGKRRSGHAARFACATFIGVLSTVFATPHVALASGAQRGLTSTEIMRAAAFWTAVPAIFLLLIAEFVLQRRIGRGAYHWLLLIGLFVLPFFCLTTTSGVILEESKTVNSCASCHSMTPFVDDMRDPASTTLAARHYSNKWISRDQCYECHTTYGIHGTYEAKRQGLGHWWRYVTNDWHRPIPFIGKYPDADCLKCHDGTPGYENAQAHQEAFKALAAGEVDCIFCHGPPHPSAEQRKKWSATGESEGNRGGADHGNSKPDHKSAKPVAPKEGKKQ